MNEKYIKYFLLGVELITTLYQICRTGRQKRNRRHRINDQAPIFIFAQTPALSSRGEDFCQNNLCIPVRKAAVSHDVTKVCDFAVAFG